MLTALGFLLVSTGSNVHDVRDFGASGNGIVDDTPAFERALTEAEKEGGTVFVPSGRYRINGHLDVPESVTLRGIFEAPPIVTLRKADPPVERGSILLAYEGKGKEDGTPFIILRANAHLKGLIVRYPEQTTDIAPYPWTVRGIGDNCSITDVLLVNPYQAVDFGTYPAGRHKIDGLYAHALKTGLFIDKCFDVGRVENVHFWPFWSHEQKVWDWTAANGTAFKIARTDWEYMNNCFAIMYRVGFHFLALADGPGNAVLTQCGSDVGPLAVKVDAVQPHSGVSLSNSQLMASVEVGPENRGPVKFTACGFWGVQGVTDEHAILRGTGHTTFTACHFTDGGQKNPTSFAIRALSGGVTVNGCEFLETSPQRRHIELAEDLEAAVISANRFRAPLRIENRSDGDVAISANVSGPGRTLRAALARDDVSRVAEIWSKRAPTPGTGQSTPALRLASAQLLTGAVRRRLLDSVASGTPNDLFTLRARDELAVDASRPTARASVSARRTTVPPMIDGVLDPVWQSAPTVSFSSGAGAPKTEGRFLWNDDALYLWVRVEEPAMDRVKAAITAHDGPLWTDDSVEFFLTPKRVTHRYLQLILNSVGAHYDGTGDLETTSARTWDPKLRVAAGKEAGAWTAEVRLPWSEIGAKPKRGDVWAMDLRRWRYVDGLKTSTWAGIPAGGTTHQPEGFGFLRFD